MSENERDCTGLDMRAEGYFELNTPMNVSVTGKGDSKVYHCWKNCTCEELQEEINKKVIEQRIKELEDKFTELNGTVRILMALQEAINKKVFK